MPGRSVTWRATSGDVKFPVSLLAYILESRRTGALVSVPVGPTCRQSLTPRLPIALVLRVP